MSPPSNLIAESVLVTDTISLLKKIGGSALPENVVHAVMKIPNADRDLARSLLEDLVESDPRLEFDDEFITYSSSKRRKRLLSESDFVVFDFETTGAKTPPCRVTEIGAVKIKGGEIADTFQSLVNPEAPIPDFITTLTSITDDMVKNAPKFAEIHDEFLGFIDDAVLVAHNAMFDMRFLNVEIEKVHPNHKIANPYLCTVRLGKKLVPEIENHKLATMSNYYGISLENHHRASDDAMATAKIFLKLLELLNEKGVDDLSTAIKCKF